MNAELDLEYGRASIFDAAHFLNFPLASTIHGTPIKGEGPWAAATRGATIQALDHLDRQLEKHEETGARREEWDRLEALRDKARFELRLDDRAAARRSLLGDDWDE